MLPPIVKGAVIGTGVALILVPFGKLLLLGCIFGGVWMFVRRVRGGFSGNSSFRSIFGMPSQIEMERLRRRMFETAESAIVSSDELRRKIGELVDVEGPLQEENFVSHHTMSVKYSVQGLRRAGVLDIHLKLIQPYHELDSGFWRVKLMTLYRQGNHIEEIYRNDDDDDYDDQDEDQEYEIPQQQQKSSKKKKKKQSVVVDGEVIDVKRRS